MNSPMSMWVGEVRPLLDEMEKKKLRSNHMDAAEEIREIMERFELNHLAKVDDLIAAAQAVLNMHAMPTEPPTYRDLTGAIAKLREVLVPLTP